VHLSYQAGSDRYTLRQADGRVLPFRVSGNAANRYLSLRASDGWLTRLDNGTVRWYDRQGGWRTFNDNGQLITISTAQGKSLRLHYDSQNRLQRVVDPQGRELTLGYYLSGRIKLLIAPDGAKTTYRYDDHNNLIEVQRPGEDGIVSRIYHYEDPHDAHNLTGITNENGIRYASWAYDDQDRAIASSHSDNVGKVTLNFDTPNQTEVTDSQGKVSLYSHTTEGGVARVLRIDGPGCDTCGRGDVEYEYNDQYQLTQIRKKTGELTEYDYDPKGRLTQISQRNTHAPNTPAVIQTYEYDGRLQPSAIVKASINPTGEHRTEIHYNPQGQPTELTERGYRPSLASNGQPDGGFEAIERTTTLNYNPAGDLIEIDGPRTDVKDQLTLSYDNKHRLSTLTTPDGSGIGLRPVFLRECAGTVTVSSSWFALSMAAFVSTSASSNKRI
jgi:YD repeat-containing protein